MSRAILLALVFIMAGCATSRPNRIPGCTGPIAAYEICDDYNLP